MLTVNQPVKYLHAWPSKRALHVSNIHTRTKARLKPTRAMAMLKPIPTQATLKPPQLV